MMLWVAMAVLAAAAALSVLVPLYRARPAASVDSGAAEGVSIYRDQLDEIGRDLDRGVIGEREAAAARTEIARRLIAADREAAAPAAPLSEGRRRAAMVFAVAGVPVLAVGLYLALGSPDLPDLPLSGRLAEPVETQDIAVLVSRVEAHLAQNPNDGAGWEVLAPVYGRLGRYDDAAKAYANTVRLLGSTAARESALGEAIVRANDGAVTAEARAAFENARALDPQAVQPRFYLALALGQEGKRDEAAAALKALIKDAPAGAPWVPMVETVLARLEAAPPAAAPGPGAADIEAAAGLSPEARAAMIEGMVGQLAARLATEPNDPAGWARLVRSYMALGRPDDAAAALASARTALAGNAEGLATVEAEARAAGALK
jgi:cytochrome c-type biogenesis protein CcmH